MKEDRDPVFGIKTSSSGESLELQALDPRIVHVDLEADRGRRDGGGGAGGG